MKRLVVLLLVLTGCAAIDEDVLQDSGSEELHLLERLPPPDGSFLPWREPDRDPCKDEERIVVMGNVIWNPTWCAPGPWIDKGDPSPLK